MHSTSLHVGYPRSPFKFTAFINALFIFMPHLGFEVVPGRQGPLASELQRRTAFEVSFAAEHQRQTASQLYRRTMYPSSNAGRYPSSNTGLCIRGVVNHLGSKKFEGV